VDQIHSGEEGKVTDDAPKIPQDPLLDYNLIAKHHVPLIQKCEVLCNSLSPV